MKSRSLVLAVLSLVLTSACSSKDEHAAPIGSPDSDIVPFDASHETAADVAADTVSASCTNGMMDSDETDVDCGGSCAACDTNGKCKTAADCASMVCTANVCVAAKCDDHVANGTETDVDCGGAPCGLCADGKSCKNETNCASGVCTAGKCVAPSCTDGVMNHGETDIDCGGPSCGKCGVGKKCTSTGDCTSARCIAESGVNRCLCPDGMQRIQLAAAGGGAYCIDGEEVNNSEYAVFLATGPDITDQPAFCLWNDNFTPTAAWPADVADRQLPVRHVDWCDAYAYCKKQGRRLCGKVGGGDSTPADAGKITDQWYNACSQGGTNVYPYAGAYASKKCNGADYWTSMDGGIPSVLPRGSATLSGCIGGPMGLIFQLSGNVKEWEDSCDGTTGNTDHCLARGGSFRSSGSELACTGTASLPRDTHADDVGFRCCL